MAEVELTSADHGATISIQLADEVVLRLPENPTTGFRWELEPEDLVEVVDDTFELDDDPLLGSGGTRVLRLRAAKRGSGRLQLKHWQPWEGASSVTRELQVNLEVAG
jgi:inhibitor of cysteine peptidase